MPSLCCANDGERGGILIVYREEDSEAAHEKGLLCAQKCTRGGVGVGWGVSCRGGAGGSCTGIHIQLFMSDSNSENNNS